MNVRIPRIQHLRRRIRNLADGRLRRLWPWLVARSTALNATGTATAFTAVPANVAATGTLTLTGNANPLTKATGTLTLVSLPLEAETVTIGTTVYKFTATVTDPGDVLIGATASDTIDNLIAAITAGAGEGTAYGTGTVAHTSVTAAVGAGDTMVVTALVAGVAANVIALADGMTDAGNIWGAANLAGGLDLETVTLGTVTYTFVSALVAANDVMIGANASATIGNLIAAITAAAGAGVTYGNGTVAHPTVTAAAGAGDTMTVTAKVSGVGGNTIASTSVMVAGGFAAVTLGGGADGDTLLAVAHGRTNGDGPFTVASDNALPTGLASDTLYWLSAVDVNRLYLHRNRTDAINGTNPVNFTTAGAGNLTLTPASSAQAIVEYLRQGKSPATIQAETDVDNLI